MAGISNLKLTISADSKQASSDLDSLTNSLKSLRSSLTGNARIKATADSISELARSTARIPPDVGAKLQRLSSGLNALSQVPRLQITKATANQITSLIDAVSGIERVNFRTIQSMASGLDSLSAVQAPTALRKTVANNIRHVGEAVNAIPPDVETKLKSVGDGIRSLTDLPKSNIGTWGRHLENIPKALEKLKDIDYRYVHEHIDRLTRIMRNLAIEMEKISQGFGAMPKNLQRYIKSMDGASDSTRKFYKNKNNVFDFLQSFKVKISLLSYAINAVSSKISKWVDEINAYVENLNLFDVAMGEFADEARAYAEEVSEVLGIDMSEWIRFQGVFKQIATGFGMASDQAQKLSQNLTQLGYDAASFFNLDTEVAQLKFQSGLAGELEPLRRIGYALDRATLQRVAYNHGIEKSFNLMTQNEKAQLRYIAIMEQSRNIMGDLARTVITPANAMRIFRQQVVQLQRALGSLLIPALLEILPYIQAFVELITEAIQALAKLVGFKMPEIDYSGIEMPPVASVEIQDLADDLDDVTGSAKGATQALREFKNYTFGYDQLHIIPSDADTVGGGGGGGVGGLGRKPKKPEIDTGEFELDLPEYDFLEDAVPNRVDEIKEKLREFFENMSKWTPILIGFGIALAGVKLATWLMNIGREGDKIGVISEVAKIFKDKGFIGGLREIGDRLQGLSPGIKVLLTLGAGIGILMATRDAMIKLSEGTLTLSEAVGQIAIVSGVLGTFIGAMWSPAAGIAVAGIGVLVGVLDGLDVAQKNAIRSEFLAHMEAYGTLSLEEFTDSVVDHIIEIGRIPDTIREALSGYEEWRNGSTTTGEVLLTFGSKVTELEEITVGSAEAMREAMNEFVADLEDGFDVKATAVLESFGLITSEIAEQFGIDTVDITVGMKEVTGMLKEHVGELHQEYDDLMKIVEEGGQLNEDQKIRLGELIEGISEFDERILTTNSDFYELIESEQKLSLSTMEDKIDSYMRVSDQATKTKEDLEDVRKTQTAAIQSSIDDLNMLLEQNLGNEEIENKVIPLRESLNNLLEGVNSSFDEKRDEIDESLREYNTKLMSEGWEQVMNSADQTLDYFLNEFKNKDLKLTDLSGIQYQIDKTIEVAQEESIGTLIANLEKLPEEARPTVDDVTQVFGEDVAKYWGQNLREEDWKKIFDNKFQESITVDRYVVEDAKGNLRTIFTELTDGVTEGLNENAKTISDFIPDSLKLGFSEVKRFFGIRSPSTVYEEVGTNLMVGLEQGIEKNKDPAINAMVSITDSMMGIFDGFSASVASSFNGMLRGLVDSAGSLKFDGRTASVNQIQMAKYATGGMPPHGQVFIAKEVPELVGSFGNKTAVINNHQIVEAVSAGVYQAVSQANQQTNQGGHTTIVQVGDHVVHDAVVREINRKNKRAGKVIVPVGG